MAATPMLVKNRPFSVEPITGVMLPDGIFDAALFEQNITCYFTNTSGGDLTNVTVYLEGISDAAIVVIPHTHTFAHLPAGASVQVAWLGNFMNAAPGKHTVSLIAKAAGLALQRQLKHIFVTRTTYDAAGDTYTCAFPEGAMQVKFTQIIGEKCTCRGRDGHAPLWVPVTLVMNVTPNPSYPGQFGDLPFQDPWWKILAIIVAIVAALGAIIAAALGGGKAAFGFKTSEDAQGKTTCCGPADGLTIKERLTVAGALSTVATGAIIVAASDFEDPWYRGQQATLPNPGELTMAENVTLTIGYLDVPAAGAPYRAQVDWRYTRLTDQQSYSFAVSEVQTNQHTLGQLLVDAPTQLQAFKDPFTFQCQFLHDNGLPFVGPQLYAYALVVSPKKVAFRVPLLDDGIAFDQQANDGIYTAHLDWYALYREHLQQDLRHTSRQDDLLGYWLLYIYAQDVNDAPPDMLPHEAATHIGGMMVASASELTFDSTLPCPLTANARVLVV